MKKQFMTLALAVASSVAFAQTSTEIGYNLGFASYLGDLQPSQYSYQNAGPASGMFVRANINSMVSFRGFANVMQVSGSDAESGVQSHINRNLSFKTNIAEFGAQIELSALPFDNFNPANNKGKRYFNYTPYMTAGLNVFHFNPRALMNGQWYDLQPLNTEGQNSSFNAAPAYKLTQIAIPFALGFKFSPAKRITFAIEFGARKTFTDYLDDVSGAYADENKMKAEKGFIAADLAYRSDELVSFAGTSPVANTARGNSSNKDWYLVNTASFTYKFYSKKKAFTGR